MIFELNGKLPKQKKERVDKGKVRTKYDFSIPKNYLSYIKRCNKKGIRLEITLEQFNSFISRECFYCGSCSKIGLDRIESGGDYSLDNCVPCCYKCNMAKYTHSQSDFLSHINKIYIYQNSKP